jgi:predicted metal-dependent peptidase
VEQAQTISKIAGKVPAGLERSLEGAEKARVDWRELLRRSWPEASPADYSWTRPNRRHIWQGLYLFLTDLYDAVPEEEPPYLVLWISTGSRDAPFGQLVPMHAA